MAGNDGPGEVTRLLLALGEGSDQASALFSVIYSELRTLAAQKTARDGAVISPTSLVHQAYLRLVGDPEGAGNIQWNSRAHFFSAAAEAMRRVLIEHARTLRAQKRGDGRRHIPIYSSIIDMESAGTVDVLELDEALRQLEENDARKADIIKLRFFSGLTVEEAALALGISARTVNREWSAARAWLHSELRLKGSIPEGGA